MVSPTATPSISRLLNIRSSAFVIAVLFVMAVGGVWELYAGGAHKAHLLSVFIAVLCLALTTLVALYFIHRVSLEESRLSQERFGMAMAAGKSVAWNLVVKTGENEWFGDLQTMFGIPSNRIQLQLEDFYQYVHPGDRSRVADAIAKARDSHTNYSAEFRIVHKDGTTRWISATGRFDYTKKGEPLRMLGIAFDITDRKQVEEALVHSEEKFSRAFRQSPVALTLTSTGDHRYLEVNETFERSTGWTRDEIIGRTPFDLKIWVDSKQRNELVKRVLSEGSIRNYEVSYRRKDGTLGIGLGSAELIDIRGEPCLLSAIIDITDRKQIEDALRAKELELAQAQHLAHVGSWQFDVKSRSLTWSEELRRIHGLAPGMPEPLYEDFAKFFTPESWQQLHEAMQHAVDTGEVNGLDLEIVRPDGTRAWVTTRGKAVRDASGNLVCIRGTTQDVTERKRAEQQLQESEARLSSVVNSAMDAIVTIDEEQRIVLFNEAAERMFQCSTEEALGAYIDRFIPLPYKLDYNNQGEHLSSTSKRNLSVASVVTLYAIRSNGERFPIEASISRVARDGKKFLTAIIRDVTERRRSEEALRDSEQRFRRVVEHIGDAVIADDVDGRITFANDRFLQLFGFTREQLHSIKLENYIAPEYQQDLIDRHRRRMRGEDVPSHFEYQGLRTDGTRMWLEVEVVPITNSDGQLVGTQSAIRDISERKRTEEAVHESEQRLRNLIEASNDWVYEMDRTGTYTYAGPQCRKMLGYEPSELIGRRPIDFVPADELAGATERFLNSLQDPKPFSRFKSTRLHKDGQRVVWETNAIPIFDKKGEFCGYRGMARDITERTRAEEALRESEERFRRVVEHIGDALAVDNVEGHVVFANDQFLNLFGLKRDEIPDIKFEDYVAPEYCEQVRDRHNRRMHGQEVESHFEYVGLRPDGTRIWLEAEVVPIRDRNGNLVGSQKTLKDITSRKKSEQALRENEERLRHLISSSNDWVWEADVNSVYTYAGPQCLDILGYEPAEIVGKTPFELMPPDEALRVASIFSRIAAEREPFWGLRNINLHKDGHIVVLETNGVPILDEQGNLRGYRGMDRDITERDRAEHALRESEERFRLVANTAPVMIWMSGADRQCNYFNRPWLDFTGKPLEAELGDGWLKGVHPDDSGTCMQTYTEAFDRRMPFEMQYRLRRHDREYRWVLDIGVPRFDPDGTFAGYIGSCIDITERKLAEEAMATIGRRLIEAHEEERTRIGRELHDDINQRLALLAVELDRWRESTLSSAELQQNVLHAQNRITEIAKDVQNLSHRLHSSKLEYLGLATAASSFCKEFSQQNRAHIDFTHQGVPRNLPQEVSLCLFRILQEALHNALKYSGVRNFTVDLHGSADTIELRVSDSGVGFEEQEAFTRQGLGLISMRERLQLVHGEFSVRSKPGAGTMICARVPLIGGDMRAMAG